MKEADMEIVLVVVRPFDTYRVGDVIADARTAQTIGASAHRQDVVRVTVAAAMTNTRKEG
jgi:hypothetical protein